MSRKMCKCVDHDALIEQLKIEVNDARFERDNFRKHYYDMVGKNTELTIQIALLKEKISSQNKRKESRIDHTSHPLDVFDNQG